MRVRAHVRVLCVGARSDVIAPRKRRGGLGAAVVRWCAGEGPNASVRHGARQRARIRRVSGPRGCSPVWPPTIGTRAGVNGRQFILAGRGP